MPVGNPKPFVQRHAAYSKLTTAVERRKPCAAARFVQRKMAGPTPGSYRGSMVFHACVLYSVRPCYSTKLIAFLRQQHNAVAGEVGILHLVCVLPSAQNRASHGWRLCEGNAEGDRQRVADYWRTVGYSPGAAADFKLSCRAELLLTRGHNRWKLNLYPHYSIAIVWGVIFQK